MESKLVMDGLKKVDADTLFQKYKEYFRDLYYLSQEEQKDSDLDYMSEYFLSLLQKRRDKLEGIADVMRHCGLISYEQLCEERKRLREIFTEEYIRKELDSRKEEQNEQKQSQ